MSAVKKTFRRQRPIKGGRTHRGAGFDPKLDSRVEKAAARYGVSIPFYLSAVISGELDFELAEEDQLPRLKLVRRA